MLLLLREMHLKINLKKNYDVDSKLLNWHKYCVIIKRNYESPYAYDLLIQRKIAI